MSTQKHCPGCGTTLSPGQPFCPRCGRDLHGSGFVAATGGGAAASGSTRPWPFSGEMLASQLAALEIIPKHVIDPVAAESVGTGRPLPGLILERGLLSQDALRDAMARIFGLPVADLRSPSIDPALITGFPSEIARRNLFLPLHREDTRLLMVV